MKNKKFHTNIILQFSIILLIGNFAFFEKLNLDKIKYFLTVEALVIILLLFFSRLFAPILFTLMFNILLKKKPFLKIVEIYLKGHLVNEAVPGLGYYYRYKKVKNKFDISILQYSSIQTLNNIYIFLSLVSLGILLGLIQIGYTKILIVPFSSILIFILFFFILFKFKFVLLQFKKIKKIYLELIPIKKRFYKNYKKFIILFILYFLQSLLQCYIFYKIVILLGFELNFFYSSYLYISSILITIVLFLNFIGLFELVLAFTSSLIIKNYVDMILVGFGFRFMGIIALLTIILIFYILNFKKKLK